MTAILGFHSAEKMFMASDRMVTHGDLESVSCISKVGHKKEFLVGAAGDSLVCNVITHTAKIPKKKKNEPWSHYFMSSLPKAWLAAIGDHGVDVRQVDIEVLVVHASGLWRYDTLLAADLIDSPVWAIGNGGHIATGAMMALLDPEDSRISCPELMAEISIDYAGRLVQGVGRDCELTRL